MKKGDFMGKRLYRSRKDKIIAGVCGGLARYFDVDPTLVRILAVISIFINGIGIIAYIVAWIIMPLEPERESRSENKENNVSEKKEALEEVQSQKRKLLGGIILVVIGGVFLIYAYVPWFGFRKLWPFVLMAIGVVVIFDTLLRRKERD